eukprot:1879990-Pyramimonas_sp.AAC.1
MNGQISFKYWQNRPKVIRLSVRAGSTNWAPAVNRQPFAPPGDSQSFLAIYYVQRISREQLVFQLER